MESFSTIYILTTSLFLLKALIIYLRTPNPITSLPLDWVGRKYEPFSKLRAFMRQHSEGLRTMMDGYNKVTEAQKPVVNH